MDILNALVRLRDDIKTWVTNNINSLNTKIDNKLDSGALPGAIDDAITQAKESGDLKGEKGDDGISATHSWNGTTLVVTSASGTSSADLKGDKGASGYTPVRGTDYWTNADKAEIESYVDNEVTDKVDIAFDNATADDFGIYVQAQEPMDAVAGDIWIDTANDPTYIPPTIPEITEADNGKVLMVVNGQLQLVNLNLSIDTNGVVSV